MSSAMSDSDRKESVAGAVRVEHGAGSELPSRAVTEAVAELAGVEPEELADEAEIVLYDHVDSDALNALVAGHAESTVDISLTIADYEVHVDETAAVARPNQ